MDQYFTRVYEATLRKTSTANVVYLKAPFAGTIRALRVDVAAAVAGTPATFNLLINGVYQWSGSDRLIIANGASFAEKTGLNLAVAKGDLITVDLQQNSSFYVSTPVVFNLTIDDAVAAGLSLEEIQDAMSTFLQDGGATTIVYDDAGNTLAINSTDNDTTPEEIMDVVAGLLAQGSNVVLTYNDAGDQLTIAATSSGTTITENAFSYTTAAIANGATENGAVMLGKTYLLTRVVADRACRVRLYRTALQRTADAARAAGTDPTGEHGVILDLVLTGADDFYLSPIVAGASGDNPRAATAYAAITNSSGGTAAVALTFYKSTLEA